MGTPSVDQPTPPTPPTAGGSLQEYIDLSPQLFETEQKYQPQYAQLAQQIQQQLYPQTSALGEQLAGQAAQGMGEQMPQEYQDMYSNQYKALLGENVKSTIGADYYSTGMLEQQKNWQDYYRNLGLTMSGRQPLVQPQPLTSGFTPQSIMGMNASNYGTQANIYGTQGGMYNTNMAMAAQQQQLPFQYLQGAGNLLGGIGSLGGQGKGFMGLS